MIRTILTAAALAGLALPIAAEARVTRTELRGDVRDVRQERHQLKHELREHDWREARQERRDLHRARHELNRDSRAYWRQHHR